MSLVQLNSVYTAIPESIEPYQPEVSKLFIELGQRHLASFVSNNTGELVYEYELFQLDEKLTPSILSEYILNKDYNSKFFQSVSFIHNSKEFVLIPAEFHKPELNKNIIETLYGDLLDFELFQDEIDRLNIINLFGVDEPIFQEINHLFPLAINTHINSIYLKSIFSQRKILQSQTIKLYFYPLYFNVAIIKDGQLQIVQSFYYETTDDAIFFLLTLIDQFNLDVDIVDIQVGGIIEEDSALYNELKRQFQYIDLDMNTATKIVSHEPPAQPLHYFTPLFLSATCE